MEERCRIGDKLCGTACEQDPLSKGLEVVKSITDPFQDLDPVVVALADAVGFVIFPGVLYISPVADHVCNMAYFRNFRRAVNLEPFGQLCALESQYGHVVDVMKTLECLIGFVEIRIGFQKLVDAFFHNRGFPVILGIDAGSTVTVDELVWYLPLSQRCRSLSQIPLSPLNSSMAMVSGSLLTVSKLIRSRME